jgi:hypothetical protein
MQAVGEEHETAWRMLTGLLLLEGLVVVIVVHDEPSHSSASV